MSRRGLPYSVEPLFGEQEFENLDGGRGDRGAGAEDGGGAVAVQFVVILMGDYAADDHDDVLAAELLELCDDLDIEPMYVCGVGIAHRDSEDWQYWIQDVLDAIEFANGDVTTKWGAVRAEMGHPEPFNMKYVEIGNEAFYQPALYEPRYQDFYDAIKEKYPDMNIIADYDVAGKTIDMVDEHYYDRPQFFMDNAYKYDGYDRDGYKVYAGEYAVYNGGCPGVY